MLEAYEFARPQTGQGTVVAPRSHLASAVDARAKQTAVRRQSYQRHCQNKYQLSLIHPRDGIVLETELDDHCDKLQRSSVGARRYCQLD